MSRIVLISYTPKCEQSIYGIKRHLWLYRQNINSYDPFAINEQLNIFRDTYRVIEIDKLKDVENDERCKYAQTPLLYIFLLSCTVTINNQLSYKVS